MPLRPVSSAILGLKLVEATFYGGDLYRGRRRESEVKGRAVEVKGRIFKAREE
jgi:hypothetical protein